MMDWIIANWVTALLAVLVVVQLVTVIVLAVWLSRLSRWAREGDGRLESVEKSVHDLSTISKYFPDFIQKGERVTRNMSEELTLKQNVLKKLISEAEKASERLGLVEEKIKENKLDKETIDKVLILVNQGFTPAEIAPKLNIPLGEIELVVKLRKYLSSPLKERL